MIGSTARIERAPPLNSTYDQSWCAFGEQGTIVGAGLVFCVQARVSEAPHYPVKGNSASPHILQ